MTQGYKRQTTTRQGESSMGLVSPLLWSALLMNIGRLSRYQQAGPDVTTQ